MAGEGAIPKKRKRWRWTKRIYAVLLVFFLATVAARVWWGHYADRKLREIKDRIAARGEPLEWKDLAPPRVPDDRNAVVLYRQAVATPLLAARSDEAAVDWSRVRMGEPFDVNNLPTVRPPRTGVEEKRLRRLKEMVDYLLGYPDFRRQHQPEARQIVEESKPAMALCRKARELGQGDWGLDFSRPAFDTKWPAFGEYRKLARIACVNALAAHEAGNDAEAVECLRDVLALADCIDTTPFLISHLVAIAMDANVTWAIEQIAPTLNAPGQAAPAGRPQVTALIDQLLNNARHTGMTLAFLGERSGLYDACERFRNLDKTFFERERLDTGPRATFNLITGPMWKLDEVRLVRLGDALVQASREKTYPARRATFRRLFPEEDSILEGFRSGGPVYAFTHMLSGILMPALSRATVLHFRAVSTRPMAATALAIRLYDIDHARRPGKLEELVGAYLPAVPDDPYAQRGPIRYVRDAKQPLLYSVNVNGKDDGGRFGLGPDGQGPVDMEALDLVFFLNGDRPRGKCDWKEPDSDAPGPLTSTTRSSGPTSQSRPAPMRSR